MWDKNLEQLNKDKEGLEKHLARPSMMNPKTEEQKQQKRELKQLRQRVVQQIKMAEYIQNRKDDYPVDMHTGNVMSLATDSKYIKHITNTFNILEARTDPGAYFAYLRHNIHNVEKNRLTLQLVKELKKAKSNSVREYIINLYKVATYQPDAASGFSWLKFDSDSISHGLGKVGMSI